MIFDCGDEIRLRPFAREDRESLVRLGNNHNVSKWLANLFPHPYTLEDADAWIAHNLDGSVRYNFAIEVRGEMAGGIGLKPMADVHAGTAELGYWLGEPYWGQGVATTAVAAISAYGLDELLFVRLQAEVFAGNNASMRVLEKNGFVREGVLRKHIRKNGVISDCVLYARLRNP
ncbi:MAG: GNAT family N-acetyltransferase [Planctomycetaceae bacterium]|nr:GNAT family N-acetyltransferase [Planctomycetaceae bacterium]